MSGNATTIVWRQAARDELSCEEAARMLEVPLAALERWSRELAFPSDVSAGGPPRFLRSEIAALRTTLASAHSVEGAIREARRRLEA